MRIDAIFSSCARPEMLEATLASFNERMHCRDGFRKVLVEDVVDDNRRSRYGLKWIEENRDSFDKVVILKKRAGPYLQFPAAVMEARSSYFFKVDDDAIFIRDINVDDMVAIMEARPTLIELVLRRRSHREVNPVVVEVLTHRIVIHEFFSISFGLYREKDVLTLMENIGWQTETHETKIMTPAALGSGMECGILGVGEVHYRHIGGELGFNKGAWK